MKEPGKEAEEFLMYLKQRDVRHKQHGEHGVTRSAGGHMYDTDILGWSLRALGQVQVVRASLRELWTGGGE